MAADRLLHALPRDPFVNVVGENLVYSCLSRVDGSADLLGSSAEVWRQLPSLRIEEAPLPRQRARKTAVGGAARIVLVFLSRLLAIFSLLLVDFGTIFLPGINWFG